MKIGTEAYNDMEKKAAMDKMTDKRKDEMPQDKTAALEALKNKIPIQRWYWWPNPNKGKKK